MSPDDSLPPVGQGALGIEIKANDLEISSLIKPLIHQKTQIEVNAERALNTTLEGGCSVAIGAFATSENSKLTLSGMVGNVDSGEIIRVQEIGETSKPIDLGIRAANKLLSLGARELLNEK